MAEQGLTTSIFMLSLLLMMEFQIIKQVWPNVNHYAREIVRDSIQPALRTNLEKYKLTGFKFERIILGTVVRIKSCGYSYLQ